ncbi:hypothetical protein XENTR_v10014007 [Xenopus tropicalis]|nr:hypothetical protein XENTR_v10014007 [Xenopus tropicalis]
MDSGLFLTLCNYVEPREQRIPLTSLLQHEITPQPKLWAAGEGSKALLPPVMAYFHTWLPVILLLLLIPPLYPALSHSCFHVSLPVKVIGEKTLYQLIHQTWVLYSCLILLPAFESGLLLSWLLSLPFIRDMPDAAVPCTMASV